MQRSACEKRAHFARGVDDAAAGGHDRVGQAANEQEHEELRVRFQRVLVRTLQARGRGASGEG
jgi:hypothetical protein